MSFLDIETGGLPPVRRQQDPSQALAAGVFQINTAVASFKRLIDSLGTPKDTPALRDKLHKTRQRIGKLAKETAAKLKTTSNHAQNDSSSPQQKVTGAKLAKDFQAVLVEFQNAQKTAQEREKYYAPFVPQAVLPDSQVSSDLKLLPQENQEQQAIFAEQKRFLHQHRSVFLGSSAFEGLLNVPATILTKDFLQLENETVFNETVIQEREQGIREIHQQIGEVNEIFKDLAVLVHEQGYMIDEIDKNVVGAEAATDQATHQLAKAQESQKSGSNIACLILVIIVVVLLILVITLKVIL